MSRSKSGLFLMELIIAICFFAISSAICVQLFAAAQSMSRRSRGLQMAVVNAQSVADGFKAYGRDIDALARFWNASASDGKFVAWFNESWENIEDADRYSMTVVADLTAVPAFISISIVDNTISSELYSVSLLKYLGR